MGSGSVPRVWPPQDVKAQELRGVRCRVSGVSLRGEVLGFKGDGSWLMGRPMTGSRQADTCCI